jgi:GNAT superfamily N-acetyltransferase
MTARPDSVVCLANPQTEQLVQVMSRAFFNDPMFLYTLPDEKTRPDKLRWFFRMLIRYGKHYGEVLTTPTADGGAIWIRPENASFTASQMVRVGFLAMPFIFGWTGFRRFMTFSSLAEKWREKSVATEHWYLAGLGVEPAEQGRGLGGALLQPGLARADAGGIPCYLETLTERNLAFYQRHGFQVAASGEIPNGGPMVWTMVRPPHKTDGGSP